jgi:protein-S-isoprenylcysteine O-methyltransferase Ste14
VSAGHILGAAAAFVVFVTAFLAACRAWDRPRVSEAAFAGVCLVALFAFIAFLGCLAPPAVWR